MSSQPRTRRLRPGTEVASRSDQAYQALRRRIVTLDLEPGSALDEEVLMAELDLGRTPIREAILRLVGESLVEVFPRRGTFVTEIQITDLAAISEVRIRLEPYAAELAAQRLREGDREQFRELLERIAAIAGSSPAAMIALDAEVHRSVYAASHNRYLEATLCRYYDLAARIWHLALERVPGVEANVRDHERLMRAILEGDAAAAAETAAAHVAAFEAAMKEAF